MKFFIVSVISLLCFISACQVDNPPLKDKIIVIDPGHGGTAETDQYRVGPTGEREEWINLRVALVLEQLLQEQGANVLLTRSDDKNIGLEDRALLAVENNAHLFLSIHHNAIADTSVNFPVIYFHGHASENKAGVMLAEALGREINNSLFNGEKPILIASDYTIFTGSGTAVLRHSYGIPGVITEASFFTNPGEENRLKTNDYNKKEAEALLRGIISFFELEQSKVQEKYSIIQLPPFPVLQAAGRMSEEVKGWKDAYEKSKELKSSDNPKIAEKALRYATLSAHLFPDSPVAKDAHLIRVEMLEKLGKPKEAATEKLRAQEFYRMINSE